MQAYNKDVSIIEVEVISSVFWSLWEQVHCLLDHVTSIRPYWLYAQFIWERKRGIGQFNSTIFASMEWIQTRDPPDVSVTSLFSLPYSIFFQSQPRARNTVITSESAELQSLVCDHSNESYCEVFSHYVACFWILKKRSLLSFSNSFKIWKICDLRRSFSLFTTLHFVFKIASHVFARWFSVTFSLTFISC